VIDRADWSRIAHGDLDFMGPYSQDSLAELFDGMQLRAGARVLDLGCGTGALLAWLADRGPIAGTGVDLQPVERSVPGVRFVTGDARAFEAPPESFDLVCSVGAVTGIADLAQLARAGGLVMLGEGFWMSPPSDAYLEALGAARDELADWESTLRLGRPAGLDLIRARRSTAAEWDAYEGTWASNGERWAADHADDPCLDRFLNWIRNGRRRYLELGGREALGFALLLFRKRAGS
jgi:SAM-dependent methyltransferase